MAVLRGPICRGKPHGACSNNNNPHMPPMFPSLESYTTDLESNVLDVFRGGRV
jgi:hypothetical protein